MRKRELKGLLTPGQDHGFTGLVSSQPPLSGEGRRAGGLRGWSMERNRLIAAVSTYQRPSAKWARRRPGSRGETMESGAILVVQRSPPAVQPRRASALPRGRGVPLPTRSGRRGGVLRVPPARGAARDAREAVHAPSPSCSARGISALAAFRWYKTGTLRGRGLPMQLVEVSRPRVRGVSAGREAGAGGGFGDTGGRQRGLKTWERERGNDHGVCHH